MCVALRTALEDWVNKNYRPETVCWTSERSAGNSDDCFNDGYVCGTSDAAFEIGRIIGMFSDEENK